MHSQPKSRQTSARGKGCLGLIRSLLGIGTRETELGAEQLPYLQRDAFLSPAEASFFLVLTSVVDARYLVFTKVGIRDLLYVPRRTNNWQSYWNKIDRKHVDFLLCDPETIQPVLAIELDDSSHSREDRRKRDEFVDRVFQAAGLPLRRLPAKNGYSADEVYALLAGAESSASGASPANTEGGSGAPTCPRCGGEMVIRTATRGKHKGRRFYGCVNYPKCRGVLPLDT